MGRFNDSLKDLGRKLTGQQISSNKLVDIIEETATNYNGATLVDGKIPSSMLPSYVDDVVEGYYYDGAFYSDSEHTHEIDGEAGKIYVDLVSNYSYRWSGSLYVQVGGGKELLYNHYVMLKITTTSKDGYLNCVITSTEKNSYNLTSFLNALGTTVILVSGILVNKSDNTYCYPLSFYQLQLTYSSPDGTSLYNDSLSTNNISLVNDFVLQIN